MNDNDDDCDDQDDDFCDDDDDDFYSYFKLLSLKSVHQSLMCAFCTVMCFVSSVFDL